MLGVSPSGKLINSHRQADFTDIDRHLQQRYKNNLPLSPDALPSAVLLAEDARVMSASHNNTVAASEAVQEWLDNDVVPDAQQAARPVTPKPSPTKKKEKEKEKKKKKHDASSASSSSSSSSASSSSSDDDKDEEDDDESGSGSGSSSSSSSSDEKAKKKKKKKEKEKTSKKSKKGSKHDKKHEKKEEKKHKKKKEKHVSQKELEELQQGVKHAEAIIKTPKVNLKKIFNPAKIEKERLTSGGHSMLDKLSTIGAKAGLVASLAAANSDKPSRVAKQVAIGRTMSVVAQAKAADILEKKLKEKHGVSGDENAEKEKEKKKKKKNKKTKNKEKDDDDEKSIELGSEDSSDASRHSIDESIDPEFADFAVPDSDDAGSESFEPDSDGEVASSSSSSSSGSSSSSSSSGSDSSDDAESSASSEKETKKKREKEIKARAKAQIKQLPSSVDEVLKEAEALESSEESPEEIIRRKEQEAKERAKKDARNERERRRRQAQKAAKEAAAGDPMEVDAPANVVPVPAPVPVVVQEQPRPQPQPVPVKEVAKKPAAARSLANVSVKAGFEDTYFSNLVKMAVEKLVPMIMPPFKASIDLCAQHSKGLLAKLNVYAKAAEGKGLAADNNVYMDMVTQAMRHVVFMLISLEPNAQQRLIYKAIDIAGAKDSGIDGPVPDMHKYPSNTMHRHFVDAVVGKLREAPEDIQKACASFYASLRESTRTPLQVLARDFLHVRNVTLISKDRPLPEGLAHRYVCAITGKPIAPGEHVDIYRVTKRGPYEGESWLAPRPWEAAEVRKHSYVFMTRSKLTGLRQVPIPFAAPAAATEPIPDVTRPADPEPEPAPAPVPVPAPAPVVAAPSPLKRPLEEAITMRPEKRARLESDVAVAFDKENKDAHDVVQYVNLDAFVAGYALKVDAFYRYFHNLRCHVPPTHLRPVVAGMHAAPDTKRMAAATSGAKLTKESMWALMLFVDEMLVPLDDVITAHAKSKDDNPFGDLFGGDAEDDDDAQNSAAIPYIAAPAHTTIHGPTWRTLAAMRTAVLGSAIAKDPAFLEIRRDLKALHEVMLAAGATSGPEFAVADRNRDAALLLLEAVTPLV
jgi:hypothetical protein